MDTNYVCGVLLLLCLQIVGDKLLTATALNYEAPVNTFIIQVQSNDTGKPSLSVTATFTITVLNVNEKPTSVNLAPNIVNENSARGTVVGYLTAVDPDSKDVPRQKFTYSLLDNAGNRFEIDGNAVKVSSLQFENDSLPGHILSPIYCHKYNQRLTVRYTVRMDMYMLVPILLAYTRWLQVCGGKPPDSEMVTMCS